MKYSVDGAFPLHQRMAVPGQLGGETGTGSPSGWKRANDMCRSLYIRSGTEKQAGGRKTEGRASGVKKDEAVLRFPSCKDRNRKSWLACGFV